MYYSVLEILEKEDKSFTLHHEISKSKSKSKGPQLSEHPKPSKRVQGNIFRLRVAGHGMNQKFSILSKNDPKIFNFINMLVQNTKSSNHTAQQHRFPTTGSSCFHIKFSSTHQTAHRVNPSKLQNPENLSSTRPQNFLVGVELCTNSRPTDQPTNNRRSSSYKTIKHSKIKPIRLSWTEMWVNVL